MKYSTLWDIRADTPYNSLLITYALYPMTKTPARNRCCGINRLYNHTSLLPLIKIKIKVSAVEVSSK